MIICLPEKPLHDPDRIALARENAQATARLLQPTVLIGKRQVSLVLLGKETSEEKSSHLKKTSANAFPLRFTTEVLYGGKLIASTIDCFMPKE